jgi:amino acid transporter
MGIIWTCVAASITGVIYILGLLYSTSDVDAALARWVGRRVYAVGRLVGVRLHIIEDPACVYVYVQRQRGHLGLCVRVRREDRASAGDPTGVELLPRGCACCGCILAPRRGRCCNDCCMTHTHWWCRLRLSGWSSMTGTSRLGWAMARDGAFPLSSWLRVVHPDTKVCRCGVALMQEP